MINLFDIWRSRPRHKIKLRQFLNDVGQFPFVAEQQHRTAELVLGSKYTEQLPSFLHEKKKCRGEKVHERLTRAFKYNTANHQTYPLRYRVYAHLTTPKPPPVNLLYVEEGRTVASSMASQPPSAQRAVLYPANGSKMVSTPYSAFIRCCTTLIHGLRDCGVRKDLQHVSASLSLASDI